MGIVAVDIGDAFSLHQDGVMGIDVVDLAKRKHFKNIRVQPFVGEIEVFKS